MAIDKKYIKLGLAGLAVVALVIGLSVGLTQSNKTKTNASAAMASGGENVVASDFDEEMLAYCSPSSSSKSGKSGGGGGKSGKSGGSGSSGSMDDGVDRGGRRLVVPGTEDYHAEQQLEAGDSQSVRRALVKNNLVRELQSSASGSAKSDKSGTGSSGKSGKSGVTSDDLDPKIRCRKPKDICGEFTTSFTSDDSSSSKSGKSGGGKSGKSGGDMSYGKSGKSGGGKSGKSGGSGSCGKSGKSGGGKSGKSGGDMSYGKSGKSDSGDSDDCPSIAPTVCDSNMPTYFPTYSSTNLPTECICEEQAYYINVETLECTRGCDINCDSLPPYYPEGGMEGTCRERGFDSRNRCIEECTSWFGNGVTCTENDTCNPVETTPEPTPFPTPVPTPSPTLEPTPSPTPVPTPSPTEGGTVTVSAEKTGPPTRGAPEV